MRLKLHQLTKRFLAAAGVLADTALFLGIALIGGLGSSWYMVEAGTRLTTHVSGPWVAWTSALRADADPYTRAHYARLGSLPAATDIATTYIAYTDSSGTRLHSSCDYRIDGKDLERWWSLSVFNNKGRLIPNAAERYTFTSDTIALGPDGRFTVSLSRDASPGNWLPTGGAGRLALAFVVLDSPVRVVATDTGPGDRTLPTIQRLDCR